MSETELEPQSIEYLDAKGNVICRMSTWISQDGDREATAEDAQMFYDESSVGEANGWWLIEGWRYADEDFMRGLKLDPDRRPPTADEIIQPLMNRFRESVKYLSDLDASVYALGFASDLARFALESRVDGSSDV